MIQGYSEEVAHGIKAVELHICAQVVGSDATCIEAVDALQ